MKNSKILRKACKCFDKAFGHLTEMGLKNEHSDKIPKIRVPLSQITDDAGNYVGENVGAGDAASGGQTSASMGNYEGDVTYPASGKLPGTKSETWSSGSPNPNAVGPINVYTSFLKCSKAERCLVKGFQHMNKLPLTKNHKKGLSDLHKESHKLLGAVREDLSKCYL